MIFSGKIDRTTAALFGVFLMLSAGYALHFMTFEEALEYVDWEVILLLFGMMTYVGQLARTGFFKYLGVKAIKLSKGNLWLIFLYLTLITTFVSMVIDNVTTILLMIPLTVEVAELMEINPMPLILGEAILSNVGGVATMIGDPPNILIAYASGYSFNAFIVHLFPTIMIALGGALFISRIIYGRWFKLTPKNIKELMKLEPENYIKDERIMKYLLIVLIFMIIFFGLQDYIGVSPALVALVGGTLALVITMEDPKKAFEAVEWPTLIFFIGLFMLVGGLDQTGLLKDLAEGLSSISPNPLIAAAIILWVAGITSAGVVSLSISRRFGYPISDKEWFKFGIPVSLLTMSISTGFLFILQYMS
ncbi:citrate transporter [Euryarchaeota archaeon ex4484_178]|nr:MAG: citrate transporter [Euryarchaeota archaeon ex4484_178]